MNSFKTRLLTWKCWPFAIGL